MNNFFNKLVIVVLFIFCVAACEEAKPVAKQCLLIELEEEDIKVSVTPLTPEFAFKALPNGKIQVLKNGEIIATASKGIEGKPLDISLTELFPEDLIIKTKPHEKKK